MKQILTFSPGAAVSLQENLNTIASDYSAMGKGRIDTVADETGEPAVQ